MTVPAAVPLVPDGGTARNLLRDELAKAEYAAAQPTLFDRLSSAFLDWFTGLFDAGRSGVPPVMLAVALALLVAGLVVALLLFGLPRLNRRSRAAGLFGEHDDRTAADLRRAAEAAFAAGDFSLAVLERFRALARSLDERTLVQVFPGTTAAAFARAAAQPLPGERDAFRDAAALFDGVRYADRRATREDAQAVARLDERVAAARPRLEPAVPG